jgi:hypothetical protein
MSVFAKDNLLAWCIVPFVTCKRGPQERAVMQQRLGIRALAYDWRDEHIKSFDEELRQLRAALEFVERNDLKIEMWKMLVGDDLQQIADVNARYEAAAAQVEVLAKVFKERGCTYGVYNHGNWGGEPATMVEVVKRVEVDNVGIVYNFFHGARSVGSDARRVYGDAAVSDERESQRHDTAGAEDPAAGHGRTGSRDHADGRRFRLWWPDWPY